MRTTTGLFACALLVAACVAERDTTSLGGQTPGAGGGGGGGGEPGGDDGGDDGGSDGGGGDGSDDGDGGDDGGDNGGGGGPEIKFDLGEIPDFPNGDDDCEGQGGGPGGEGFSYIWIANSSQGTVSKINTRTGQEEGRYWTHPDMSGSANPSRTSVNLVGDVAVSNRGAASTTKFSAAVERCIDANGNGAIETSSGPGDLRPWGQDECMIWHLEIPDSPGGSSGPRPTQWEGGKHSDDPCEVDPNPRLWIGYRDANQNAQFIRVDGATGTVLDQATYPNWTWSYGPYGGVVNADGDLWASGLWDAPLLKIDADTLNITDYGNPGSTFYGIGIDASGNPWIAGGNDVSMFDDIAQQWVVIPVQNGSLRGIQIDRDGRAWAAGNSPCGLVELDVATRTVINPQVALPGCGTPVGVSIDIDGYVWSPDQSTNKAFKLDPGTHQVVLVATGLVSPYTYSDMTGAGLGLVTNPPG